MEEGRALVGVGTGMEEGRAVMGAGTGMKEGTPEEQVQEVELYGVGRGGVLIYLCRTEVGVVRPGW